MTVCPTVTDPTVCRLSAAAALRHPPSWLMVALGVGWIARGEFPTRWAWQPPGSASPLAAFTMATYGSNTLSLNHPLLRCLAMMLLGWVLGRNLTRFAAGQSARFCKAVALYPACRWFCTVKTAYPQCFLKYF